MEPIQSPRIHRGVTVVELLVVLGIIGILSIVVVTSHTTFNKTLLLSYTAYDVALTIRAAETYGLGTRAVASNSTRVGYGIRFTENSNTFTLFADADTPTTGTGPTVCHTLRSGGASGDPDAVRGDCIYDAGEEVTSYALGNRMTVETACVLTPPSTWSCGAVDIVFARPDTRAFFARNGTYNNTYTKARIGILSSHQTRSYVCVGRTGEIRVASSSTAC